MAPKKTRQVSEVTPITKSAEAKQLKKVVAKVDEVVQETKVDTSSSSVSASGGFTDLGDYQGKLGNGKFSKDKILISSWNVNGIRAVLNRQDLQNYIKSANPDVICINETKVDTTVFKKDTTLISSFPSEYIPFWNFCKPPSKGYAGTVIFSKVPPISVIRDIGHEKHDQEGRTTTLEFEKFYLVSCYVPNAGQGLERLDYRTTEWDVDFEAYLTKLRSKKHVILTGDLNVCHHEIDIAKPKGNTKTAGFTKEERQKFTELLSHGWVDTYRHKYPTKVQYSFWSARTGARKTNAGWRLDYFVVDKNFIPFVTDSIINDPVMGSDHCPIELIIDNKSLKS